MEMIKKIGVLTSGGDAPGMNAAIRAVVREALTRGVEVVGIRRGYAGLYEKDYYNMDLRSVSNILLKGGTILHSARFPQFAEDPENVARVLAENCCEIGIQSLVTIGGDGTFRGALDLAKAGIPCVGIPGTIDNDISCSEYTIGYDTAINTCMELGDKLRDTSQSHDRCYIVEIMGNKVGHLALAAGVAMGATSIIVPEIEIDVDEHVIKRIEKFKQTGKKNYIIAIAEGVKYLPDCFMKESKGKKKLDTNAFAEYIQEKTGLEARASVLGHVQRGGAPSARDRIVASQMGAFATEVICQGKSNRVVVMENEMVVSRVMSEALSVKKTINYDLYEMAHRISI